MFEVEALGRGVTCPGCGNDFTARPAALWSRLEKREALIAAGRAGAAMRPRDDDPLRQRRYLYHQPPPDAAGAELAGDPMYEASVDRAAPASAPCDLVAVLDDIRSRWNVGAIFRTADAAGFAGLILAGITATPPSPMVAKTALGAQDMVPWSYRASVLAALGELRDDGRELIALELTGDAEPVFEHVPPERGALVLGNEVAGVSAEALALCRRRVAIPMAGRKGSLNVAVAFGVAAFALTRAWRARYA